MQGLCYLQEDLCSHRLDSVQIFHLLHSLTCSVDVFNESWGLLLPFSVRIDNLEACGLYQSGEKINNTWVIKPALVCQSSSCFWDCIWLSPFLFISHGLTYLAPPNKEAAATYEGQNVSPHIHVHLPAQGGWVELPAPSCSSAKHPAHGFSPWHGIVSALCWEHELFYVDRRRNGFPRECSLVLPNFTWN